MRKDASFPPPIRPQGSRRRRLARHFAAALRAAPARVADLARLAMPARRARPTLRVTLAALLAMPALRAMPALLAMPAALLAGAALLGAPVLLAAPAGTAAAPAPAAAGPAGAHSSAQAGAPASIQAGPPAPLQAGALTPSQAPPAPGDPVLDVILPGTAPRQLAAPASRGAAPAPPVQHQPPLRAGAPSPPTRGHGAELTLAALAGALAVLGGRFAWQRRPRRCPRCGQAMHRLEGAAAFAELDMAERTEHLIGEVRYRVWRCAACAEVAKEGDLRTVSNAVAAAAGPAGSSAFLRRQAHSGLSILPRQRMPPPPPDPGHPGETTDPVDPAETGEP